jgi:hypothetical protein
MTIQDELPNASEDFKRANPQVFGVINDPVSSTSGISKTTAKTLGENKYHNRRTLYNGVTYDSKKEARYAAQLDLRVKAGEIDFWLYHVRFPIGGDPPAYYESDFETYFWHAVNLFEVEVIEVKMWRKATKEHKAGFYFTPEAKLKMKLFRAKYPNLKITIV